MCLLVLLGLIAAIAVIVAYCDTWDSMVSLSVRVCLVVMFVSPVKMAEPMEMPFGGLTRVVPRNHLLDGGPNPPRGRG